MAAKTDIAPSSPTSTGVDTAVLRANAYPIIVLNTNAKAAQSPTDTPWDLYRQVNVTNAANVRSVQNPAHLPFLDIACIWEKQAGNAGALSTEAQVRLFGQLAMPANTGTIPTGDATRLFPGDADSTNYGNPLSYNNENLGYWVPLLQPDGSGPTIGLGTAVDHRYIGVSAPLSWSTGAYQRVYTYGCRRIMCVVSQAAVGTEADTAMIVGFLHG